jgi:hypothetical protein
MFRLTSIGAIVVAAFGTLGAPNAALAENGMCNGRTAETAAAALIKDVPSRILRVLIKLKATGEQDRAAIDGDTLGFAETLRQAGAYVVEPIHGQRLLVAELDKDRLLSVAKDPRVACITRDSPEGTN